MEHMPTHKRKTGETNMILVSTYVIGLTEKSFEVELVNDCQKLVNIGLKKCSCGRW